jgi:hypothetical protein
VGLVECEECWATTGRGKGRWHGRQLEMTEDACDHRLLGDDGNEAQGAPSAPGTRGHLQVKGTSQEPGPGPIRRARRRCLAISPLLAWGGTDRVAQLAVRVAGIFMRFYTLRRSVGLFNALRKIELTFA